MHVKFSSRMLIVLSVSLAGAWSLRADTVSGGAVLTNWTGPGSGTTIGTSGSPTFGGPYWNNKSSDSATGDANIGWCVAGGGHCTIPNAPGTALSYYSTGSGGAPANLYFTGNIGTNTASTFLISITSQQGGGNGIDNLFYYLTNSAGTIISASPSFLFSSAASANTTVAMSIPAGDGYGFELTNGTVGAANPNTYLMNDTGGANTDSGNQHFAVFQQTSSIYYIGVEDTPFAISDKDYNDMVFRLTTTPEPASAALLGGSLVLMGAFVRRRNRTRTGK